MDFPNPARDFPRKSPTLDGSNRPVDLLAGEPLQGSGFEDEKPEPDFQFDWHLPTDRSAGGIE